ncbi:hypothetical protein MNBD_GAMMA21-1511 [hydrothermal vent metagenome]|uniref:Aspartate ammonia-lyase n=1 Tax=hydrothermal vent metagenome TaxID=652676 RepID=A0A3B1A7A9_9ZZZZ
MNDQNKNVLDSKIMSVTVFTDRAQVMRRATITLGKGEHICLFDALPDSIEVNSIQVNGSGNAMLKDVQFKQAYYTEIPDAEIKGLHDQQQQWVDQQRVIQDKINQVEQEKQFISNITTKLTAESEESHTSQLDPEKWVKMVEFYRSKMSALDAEIRESELAMRELEKQQAKITNEISIKGNARKERKQVEVLIDAQDEDDVILELSYIVYGPSWRPYYDLRVNSDSKVMNITYNANICQNTAEDWSDVRLQLSTAQANVSGQQPELSPWHLSEFIPEPEPVAVGAPAAVGELSRGVADMTSKKRMKQMMQSEVMASFDKEEGMFDSLEALVMSKPTTTVETKATSVVFNIAGTSNIDSDNVDHKVTILMEEFPASFRYSCVPRLTPYAYLKAEVSNNTDYPFLAGPTNIFLDNNFVANAEMELIASGEKFWTYLGVDEAVKVEHKFLKRNSKQEGMFSKSNSYTYEYLIEVTNNKKTQEDIVIWDQLPISNHEKIEVKLITPTYKEDSKDLKKNEFNYLEWFFKPAPGEKVQVPLKFSVEYPVDMRVEGL